MEAYESRLQSRKTYTTNEFASDCTYNETNSNGAKY